ncbi:MAG TPA: hypothetical protein VHD32_00425 [Candidatus Didemnitutus sp.]|nr:hypothetical protein [Candidatus Didemnitutus sp.]
MDHRIALLNAFYRGLPRDRAKIETSAFGFDFLERLLGTDTRLEYGELTLSGVLHKYKLAGISAAHMDRLLHDHVAQTCNVCLYFDEVANDVFCFNLDNNHKTENTVVIPEMECAVRALRDLLTGLGCEPLVIASGRGFHVWGRLQQAVPNGRLHEFLLRAAVKTLARLHAEGLDHQQVKINLYPDKRLQGAVSLRLFGTAHAKNKVFSRVLTPEGLLDEADSWKCFEEHLHRRTIGPEAFDAAAAELARAFA